MDYGQLFTNVLNEMLGPTAIAYALAAIGLNIHFGLTGLINMGQAGFMLLGAYGFAVATIQGAPLWLAFVVAITAAVVFALLLGLPTLKLRGDYLAIVTIAAAEIVRMVGRSTALTDVTGGSEGLTGNAFKGTFQDASPFPDDRWALGPITLATNTSNSWWLRIVGWGLVLLACLLVWRLIRSPWGRVLKGIREDEDAVRALGKNVYGYKLQALVLGGVFGALGGIVFVLASSVQADSLGRPVTFNTWTILLLGGAATVFGPVLGSLLFWGSLVFVRGFLRGVVPPEVLSVQQIEQIGWILVGLTLMMLIVFRPQGILGDKKELAINAR
ncbi:branched-chain amino acid ABC transporter permease [Cellulomonas xiejunii]|uniref:Branched-chain amino acid ABC transporter permease n=1 Tax=Cellulomonas xiejunii TaxID=2968083 RepID=A0ABY5KM96_9CELL|nr:branched-chain amino acid ABC transporter permease [Cellulomonas xiejunii]MCC2313133.1 branched-chain amino acid ABC transporter permease [Cellulomonas xiejunii]MCC2319834.1 branched-chain amino acid ABC transporter permease [Cellulomonas xiejunii]UUI70165.1 branched-chain amino acid ABC transporter permease [Cellulomonas xiejunii]